MAGPWQIQIPPNGAAVKASHFDKEAEAALRAHRDARGDALASEENHQIQLAIKLAAEAVSRGAVGKDHIYVSLSGNTNPDHEFPGPGGTESILSISIYQRPTPAEEPKGPVAEPVPEGSSIPTSQVPSEPVATETVSSVATAPTAPPRRSRRSRRAAARKEG